MYNNVHLISETYDDIAMGKLQLLQDKKAVLSQGEPRDAAVNFDTYQILQ